MCEAHDITPHYNRKMFYIWNMNLYHSNTTFWQIRQIYNITIDRSNVLYLLNQYNQIKKLMEIDLSKGQDFKFVMPKEEYKQEHKEFFEEYFKGYEDAVDYNRLLELFEYINNQIERITRYVDKYKSFNKKIFPHTKLYDVIEYIKLVEDAEHAKHAQSLDPNNIADQIVNRILKPANTNSDTRGKRPTARQVIEADRFKKALKRKSKD